MRKGKSTQAAFQNRGAACLFLTRFSSGPSCRSCVAGATEARPCLRRSLSRSGAAPRRTPDERGLDTGRAYDESAIYWFPPSPKSSLGSSSGSARPRTRNGLSSPARLGCLGGCEHYAGLLRPGGGQCFQSLTFLCHLGNTIAPNRYFGASFAFFSQRSVI